MLRLAMVNHQVQDALVAVDRLYQILDLESEQSGASDKALARKLAKLAKTAADGSGDALTQKRRASLASTLDGIAARLR